MAILLCEIRKWGRGSENKVLLFAGFPIGGVKLRVIELNPVNTDNTIQYNTILDNGFIPIFQLQCGPNYKLCASSFIKIISLTKLVSFIGTKKKKSSPVSIFNGI